MSNGQSSDPQQLQTTDEQDRQIHDWVSKERSAGTFVRKDQINWFAERVHRRDGTGHQVTPGFADEFLHRHPNLAESLIKPSPPELDGLKFKKPKHASERLRERLEQVRTRAMYGDNPPPARQPAPFPDGDIIYNCNYRYVVRHGDTITKLTTHEHGFGASDTPNEALALRFIRENTTIPVPEVISSDWDRVTMEYIEGQTLRQAWPVLTPSERSEIMAQLRDYIAQLRALPGIYLGRMDGQAVLIPGTMITRAGGPFRTLREFHYWLANPLSRARAQSMHWHQITSQLGEDYPIVFTHGDIAARNIMVRDGRIVAILDWEFAGWLPEYWEYAFALRGLDNIDWETLGQHLPDLFAKRYDLEYILMGFIINLS